MWLNKWLCYNWDPLFSFDVILFHQTYYRILDFAYEFAQNTDFDNWKLIFTEGFASL